MAAWRQTTPRGVKSAQAATDAPPADADVAAGLALANVTAFALTVECDVGQSFAAAAGQLDVYMRDEQVGAWSLVLGYEQEIPQAAVGLRRFTWLFDVRASRGRLALIANGLNLTGGGVTLTMSPMLDVTRRPG